MPVDALVKIIDDDEGVRSSLAFLLDCWDIRTRTFASPEQFLEIVSTIEPGCIITDVRMPGMNGLELVARLKEMCVPDPLIIITGHADVSIVVRATRAGIAGFIEKPFTEDGVLAAVRSALARDPSDSDVEGDPDRQIFRDRLLTLSVQETEVMEGMIEGKSNTLLAHDLSRSLRSIEMTRATLMTKMAANTLSELVRMALIARAASTDDTGRPSVA